MVRLVPSRSLRLPTQATKGSGASKPRRAATRQERIGVVKTRKPTEQDDYGDNFLPVIPVDRMIHTATTPHCGDPDCPCNISMIDQLQGYYNDGLLSPDDATRIINGKTISGRP